MLATCVVTLLLGAAPATVPVPAQYQRELPAGFQPVRADAAALGKKLFFDPLLSKDKTVSCGSCHAPEKGFTDGRRFGVGVGGATGGRSTPAAFNRALTSIQFWDGRAKSLEEQALGPIENPVEMALPVAEAVKRLNAAPDYVKAFQRAFGGPPTKERLGQALAAYERTLFSVDAPFDRFQAGEKTALNESAQRGLKLFGSKARCGECHSGVNFSDEDFHVLGVGHDEGRGKLTGKKEEVGALKTPTLRDLKRTGPYMHDGSHQTLAEVLDYYDRGGDPVPNLDKKMTKLNLTAAEKTDLLAFLDALNGQLVDFEGPIAGKSP
jgi:cytochrome c peroxidase